MQAIDMNPLHGPSIAERKIAPDTCPLEPVPGIEKFSICAANTKAPMTPASAIFRGSKMLFARAAQYAKDTPDTATMDKPTAGDIKASAMCIFYLPNCV